MAGLAGNRIAKSWEAREDVGGFELARCLSRSWTRGHSFKGQQAIESSGNSDKVT